MSAAPRAGDLRVLRSPEDRQWYVMGYVARAGRGRGGYWMSVSVGYPTRGEAAEQAGRTRRAEVAARAELDV